MIEKLRRGLVLVKKSAAIIYLFEKITFFLNAEFNGFVSTYSSTSINGQTRNIEKK